MSYSQFPTTNSDQPQNTPKKDNRNIIYGILIAVLVLTWGYIIWDKSKTKEQTDHYESVISKDSLDQAALKEKFDVLSGKADSLTVNNQQLQGALAEKQSELQKLKSNIAATLNKKNATAAELAQAKKQIAEYQTKIDDLFAQVEKLKAENQQLTATNEQLNTEKTQLTTEKGELQSNLQKTQAEKANVEDLASTLHASNINITAMQEKSGGKEKETTKAKRADFFKVSFDIDENRVSPTGTKQMYVCVYNPDGSVSTSAGTFTLRENNESKAYTSKVDVNYEQGKRVPVSFNWKPGDKFVPGDYRVEIYHNGFKIGEGKKSLKKGGLFG